MMRYGERRAGEFFGTLAFEEAWTSGNPDAVLGYFSEEAEIRLLGAPQLRDGQTSYRGKRELRDFIRERLAGDVRINPAKKQVAGEAVTWTVRISPGLSGQAESEPAEGAAEAVFEEGKIRRLTLAPRV
jgi:hypothetical protein